MSGRLATPLATSEPESPLRERENLYPSDQRVGGSSPSGRATPDLNPPAQTGTAGHQHPGRLLQTMLHVGCARVVASPPTLTPEVREAGRDLVVTLGMLAVGVVVHAVLQALGLSI